VLTKKNPNVSTAGCYLLLRYAHKFIRATRVCFSRLRLEQQKIALLAPEAMAA
jgi:hypothetical protein